MSDWIRIACSCRHCGLDMEARYPPNPIGSAVLAGALPLEFRHINGERGCIIRREAEPYSIWDANKAWQRARALPEENDDELRLPDAAAPEAAHNDDLQKLRYDEEHDDGYQNHPQD